MRIAVTYENGAVFQHFGHCENFKIYNIADGEVVSSEIVAVEGSGHDAVAEFLSDRIIDTVICGGLGEEAVAALMEKDIEVCAGVYGLADDAVAAYLNGELDSSSTSTCGCDGDCGGGCGGGCGGCGGGCHAAPTPAFEGKNVGKTVRTHYRGTFNDGTQFDSSYDRGEPLEFVCGAGRMIRGYDQAVANMEVGQIINVHLMPSEAYGEKDPNQILTIEIAQLPGSEDLSVGERVYLSNAYGQPIPVTVTAKDDVNITLDANSEMAGKELNFQIELVEVLD